MRIETIGDAILYLGNCLDILPTLSGVDAVVTDPPYGINGGAGTDAKTLAKGQYSSTLWNDTEDYILSCVVPILASVITKAKRGAITPGNRCISFYPRPADIGCFWVPASPAHGPWGFNTFHPILFYGKDYRAGKGAWPNGRQLEPANEKIDHPCPKPARSWQWLVEKVSQDGELVCDPFMGSGTTGVACARLGRKFIGCEIEPKYFDIACRRIEEAQRQRDLFVHTAPQPQAETPDMFA